MEITIHEENIRHFTFHGKKRADHESPSMKPFSTQGIPLRKVLLMRQEAKEYPSFPLGNRLYIRLGLNSRGKTFHTPSEEKEDYSACILRKAEQTLLRP